MTETVIKNPSWWRRRSAMERGLTLLAMVALLAAVALAISLGVLVARRQHQSGAALKMAPTSQPGAQSPPQDVCLTAGCVRAASKLLDKLDPSVDPCDDFYQYACGNYLRTTVIPDDKEMENIFLATTEELLQKLRTALEEKETQGAVPRTLQLARKLYRACLDKPLIEVRGLAPLQKLLREQLGGWPVLEGDSWDEGGFDWWRSVHRFLRAGHSINNFIYFSVSTDARNSTRRTITLSQAALGMAREYLLEGPSNRLVDAYHQYQVDLAVLLGADRARAQREMREALEFEMALANISLPREQLRDPTKLYNRYTVDQLQREFPYVQWLEYLQNLLPPHLNISNDEVVIVSVPSYLKNLGPLLSNTPKRVMANYALWQAASISVMYSTDQLLTRKLAFFSVFTGKKTRDPRWKVCVRIVADSLPHPVGALYVRKYFDENTKMAAREMVDDIRQQFLRVLQDVDWMDEGTRKKALEKADGMFFHIAYPDELMDDSKLDHVYEKLEVSPTEFLECILNVTRFHTDYSFGLLHQPINKTDWMTHSEMTDPNAYYDSTENSISLPAPVLQGDFFSADRPHYINYGAIGFFIGHEITHGFDDRGRHYDKDGNLLDWWDPVTRDKYLKKAECIISQYGNYTEQLTGLHLNGHNTQGENIADNGGIKEAYRAYLALEQRRGRPEPRLPALQGLSPRQVFWLSTAQTFCAKVRPEAMLHLVTVETHAPDHLRIVGLLSNQPEFAEDFACPLGSRMNPVQKCPVW